jgi:phosphoglycerate dehydrogenase-like enzyme
MTQVLLHANAYTRIKDQLHKVSDTIEPVIFRDDGTAWLNNEQMNVEGLAADAAWMSNDFFRGDAARTFAIAILKSQTIKWFQTASAGLDSDFFQSVMDKGIRLSNSDAQARAIAEFVLAQVIAHYQPIEERREAQKSRTWQQFGFREIYKTKWTIIGFGNIGSEIGKRARGFDAHVTGIRRTPGDHGYADAMATPGDVPELLPQSDVVVLACPLNEATRGLVDARFLSAMKEGATLVNIGRGDLINEDALLEGLAKGQPDFAILDVFATEPLPEDSPLWACDNIAISAHTSAFGSGTSGRGDELFLENLARFLAGEPLRNEVDPARI